jgi:two-component sensor histidine kinase
MADEKSTTPIPIDSLALAVIASSDAPVLLLDDKLCVIASSVSFSRAFQIDATGLDGCGLFAIGEGQWDVPQLRSVLKAALSGAATVEACEIDLKPPGRPQRRLVITAHRIEYDDKANTRLMLAVSDVTDARFAEKLKDDLLHEKAMLFQELQHRIANSLQIIASVLMQSARRVQSAETQGHLRDAHSRVMSVAALQNQLVASGHGEVELGPYFTELCESIGASMIHDPAKLALTVEADDSVASPDGSVSLGLIVTELVINALKHAFPADQGGHILVDYRSTGPDWTLSVTDDGVGMPRGGEPATAGLGTSIVEALAKQLGATVTVADANPGVRVSIVSLKGA